MATAQPKLSTAARKRAQRILEREARRVLDERLKNERHGGKG
jgi:hypothetical protein